MIIRPFEKGDEKQVLTIWLEASIIAHDFIPAEYWKEKVNDMRDIYLPSSKTYVYIQREEVKGFLSLVDNYIAALFVSPKEQGKGIGKELMKFVKNLFPVLELGVYSKNENSVAFYKKQDFQVINEKVDEPTGHRELVMRYTVL